MQAVSVVRGVLVLANQQHKVECNDDRIKSKTPESCFAPEQPLVYFPLRYLRSSQVLDKSRVVKLVARDTRRSVWLVQGSRGAPYLCLREYCSCR